ncbi:MAG: cyclodeaminase/cyclohydrolase family protein [Firmicutes bacterium]|jgi:formiminotetrahydrofolate cyclodeaminase|nr:cyclodeaminase/cyclohydrolase family protein [Bacillota bacterium]
MIFSELKVSEYAEAVAKGSPTPGGGSVSAVVAGLSAALIGMVGSLTASRISGDDDTAKTVLEAVNTAGNLRADLLVLAEEDAAAYDKVIAAFRLPKTTEEEKQNRVLAIQDAFKEACRVPAQVMKASLEVLRLSEIMMKHGMKSALSDVAVSCLVAWAGMRGAHFNIKINLPSIKDKSFVRRMEDDIGDWMLSGIGIFRRVMDQIDQDL